MLRGVMSVTDTPSCPKKYGCPCLGVPIHTKTVR